MPRKNQRPLTRTLSGRVTSKPQRYDTYFINIGLTQSEANYFVSIIDAYILYIDGYEEVACAIDINAEIACVGVVIGGEFQNTKELHVMKYH